jgi:hypothetical protein
MRAARHDVPHVEALGAQAADRGDAVLDPLARPEQPPREHDRSRRRARPAVAEVGRGAVRHHHHVSRVHRVRREQPCLRDLAVHRDQPGPLDHLVEDGPLRPGGIAHDRVEHRDDGGRARSQHVEHTTPVGPGVDAVLVLQQHDGGARRGSGGDEPAGSVGTVPVRDDRKRRRWRAPVYEAHHTDLPATRRECRAEVRGVRGEAALGRRIGPHQHERALPGTTAQRTRGSIRARAPVRSPRCAHRSSFGGGGPRGGGDVRASASAPQSPAGW